MSGTVVETKTLRVMGVVIESQHTGQGEVRLLPTAHVSAGIDDKAVITVGYKPIATVGSALKGQPTVNVGMVYTSTISDDLEVWWCDGWKMLWNKKTKVLWPEE